MRLNDETRDLNLRISPTISPDVLPPDIVTNKTRRKKIMSYILGGLVILLVITTTSFVLLSPDIVSDYNKFSSTVVNRFLNRDVGYNLSQNNERQFNPSNLSYYTDSELGKLGVLSLPQNFQIQEIYKGIRFVRSQNKNFSNLQINLLKKFIDKTPNKLLTPGPTAIITYQKGEVKQGTNFNPNTAAFASGTYIFFNDESFSPSLPLADNSIDAAFSTFVHELSHVSQFNYVSKNLTTLDIDNSYTLGYTWIDLVLNSDLIADFASYTNWQKTIIDKKIDYELVNKEDELTTDYGKSRIYEDMAETLSNVVITNTSEISASRVEWALKYLNTNLSELKIGKFPFSEKYEQVNANNLIYDTSKELAYKKSYGYSDRQIFINQTINTFDDITKFVSAELNNRGWSGQFTRSVDASNIIRLKGEFTGNNRDMYIEIYTYDQARGFSIKPKGTIMVVINGYLKQEVSL